MMNKGSKPVASGGLAMPCTSLRRRRLSCGSVGLSLPFGLHSLSSRFCEEALGSTREREQLHGLQSCLVCDLVRSSSSILYEPPARVSRASHIHLSVHVFEHQKLITLCSPSYGIACGERQCIQENCDSTASVLARPRSSASRHAHRRAQYFEFSVDGVNASA
ncbi:hypothetical protein EDB19DRAFT_1280185 [Suillus lakei]|nr:hypothetical protein EDB19DRAFT_1280185 [Suillus lakei]